MKLEIGNIIFFSEPVTEELKKDKIGKIVEDNGHIFIIPELNDWNRIPVENLDIVYSSDRQKVYMFGEDVPFAAVIAYRNLRRNGYTIKEAREAITIEC